MTTNEFWTVGVLYISLLKPTSNLGLLVYPEKPSIALFFKGFDSCFQNNSTAHCIFVRPKNQQALFPFIKWPFDRLKRTKCEVLFDKKGSVLLSPGTCPRNDALWFLTSKG